MYRKVMFGPGEMGEPIVPDTRAMQEVACSEPGTLTALRARAIHIEMSTLDAEHTNHIRDAALDKALSPGGAS
jgi:3-hydroxyisobutyrate dehydrogenase-like beta-hydroxyacid dehydrogenase